jgi:hypothetical protein
LCVCLFSAPPCPPFVSSSSLMWEWDFNTGSQSRKRRKEVEGWTEGMKKGQQVYVFLSARAASSI